MPRFECSKCGSLVVVGQGVETATCNVCGKKQSVPAEAVDDGPVATRSNYDPQWDHYEKLLHKARRYSDIRILKETAEEFDRLGDYENSWEMAQFCRKRIAEEEIKRQDEVRLQEIKDQRQLKGRKKNRLVMWLMNIGVVMIIVVPTLIWNAIINPIRDYREAESLMAKGRYEDAIDIFADLDGFKDSEDRIAECEAGILETKYNNAVDAMNNGRFSSAQSGFELLNDYKDSAELAVECRYQNACVLLEKRNYERAFKEFRELGDYKDSEELLLVSQEAYNEQKYNSAIKEMNDGDYEMARIFFKGISGYKDSDTLVAECGYILAVRYMDNERYDRAQEEFADLGDYKDSQELIKECSYRKAAGYMEREQYQQALKELEKILEYKDAVDLAEQVKSKLSQSE